MIAIGNEYFFKASDFYKISDNESLSKLAFFCLHTVILYVTFGISVFTIKGSNGGSYSRILTYVFVMFNSVGPKLGRQPQRWGHQCIDWPNSPQKLYENERNRTEGDTFLALALDPPMVKISLSVLVVTELFNIAVNDFGAKKSARYNRILVLSGINVYTSVRKL